MTAAKQTPEGVSQELAHWFVYGQPGESENTRLDTAKASPEDVARWFAGGVAYQTQTGDGQPGTED